MAAASSTCSAVIARSAATEEASTLSANRAPSRSASARGWGVSVPMSEPLSRMPPAIRSFDRGETTCPLTEIDPADSPAIVTRFGSPPNAAMFRLTQWSASLWSSRP